MINIDKLYDLMADKGFQEPTTGNLFFPAYIYTYQPEKEYEIREQLHLLSEKLKRPNNFLECMVINIYHEMIAYLKSTIFAEESLFDGIIRTEMEDPEEAHHWMWEELNDDKFYYYIENKVRTYFEPVHEKRVYLILYGFGSAFPYLRASQLLKRTEKLIKEFKVIVFYPGEYANARYNLFGLLDDDHMYRANNLNIQLGEPGN